MAEVLTGRTGNNLTDEFGEQLTDEEFDVAPPVDPTLVFPLFLGLRLRLHAAWLLFMLIPG